MDFNYHLQRTAPYLFYPGYGYAQLQVAPPAPVWTFCPITGGPPCRHMTPPRPEALPGSPAHPQAERAPRKRPRKRTATATVNFSEKYRRLMEATGRGGAVPRVRGNGPAAPPHPDSFAVMYRTWMEVMIRNVERAKLGQATATGDGHPRAKMADTAPPLQVKNVQVWDTPASTVREIASRAEHQIPVPQNSPGEPLYLFYPDPTPVLPQDPQPSASLGQAWEGPFCWNLLA